MTASVSQVVFVALIVAALTVIVAGGWVISRDWDHDLTALEQPAPYRGVERRTVNVRPQKIVRPRDKWDMPEVDA